MEQCPVKVQNLLPTTSLLNQDCVSKDCHGNLNFCNFALPAPVSTPRNPISSVLMNSKHRHTLQVYRDQLQQPCSVINHFDLQYDAIDGQCTPVTVVHPPMKNCDIDTASRWLPNTFAQPSHEQATLKPVYPVTPLLSQHIQYDAIEDSKGGSGLGWPWRWNDLHLLRKLPCDIRFKIVFLSFFFISSLLLSTVTRPSNYRKETSAFLAFICLLQPAEALLVGSYHPHMRLNLGSREATNRTSVLPLKGSPNTGYCVMIGIGSENQQEFCVLLDTGSANFAVASKNHPDIDSWFLPDGDLGTTVTVSYTAGSWTGRLAKDSISIGGSNPVEAFLVVIESAEDFYIKDADWVGIMGLAYSNLAKPDSSVTPFWEAFQAATGKSDIFSFRFCPPLDIPLLDITEPKGGDMVLGGIDETLYHGPVLYTSLVQQKFYNVLVTNMTVGETVISLDCGEFNDDQSIVDSGTTDVFLPQKVFTEVKKAFIENYKDGLPLHVPEEFWNGGYKLAWPVDDKHSIYNAFPTFYVSFATHNNASLEFCLAVTPQIYLRQIKGTSEEQANTNCFPECNFFTFGIKQRQQGTVIGGNIMLGFYTIFDRENKRIGFAESTCKYQDNLGGLPHIVGPYVREPINCECVACKQGKSYWEIITYVCGAVVIPLALISVMFAAYRKISHSKCTERGWIPKCRKECCSNCCRNYYKLPTPETGEGEQAAPPKSEGACGIGPAIDTDDGLQEQIQLMIVKGYSTEAEEGKEREDALEHNEQMDPNTLFNLDSRLKTTSQSMEMSGVQPLILHHPENCQRQVEGRLQLQEPDCTAGPTVVYMGQEGAESETESYDFDGNKLSKTDRAESVMTESFEDGSGQRSETNPNDDGVSSEIGARRHLFWSTKQKIVGFSHLETEDMPLLSIDGPEKEFKDTNKHTPVVYHTVCTEAPIHTLKPSVCTSSEMLADVSRCDYFITGTCWPDP